MIVPFPAAPVTRFSLRSRMAAVRGASVMLCILGILIVL